MTEKIYIIRHGFRLNWISTTWLSPTGLPRDPPLAAFGETQAEEVSQYFLSLPEEQRPTAIFSSPYFRCLQTAAPTAQALKIPVYVEHGIAEWYSPVMPGTGLHPRPGNAHALKAHFAEIDPSWTNLFYPSRKGETIAELHSRIDTFCRAFFGAVVHRLPPEQRKRLVMITHAATAIALVRTLLGDKDINFKAGCCSISEVVSKADVANSVVGAYRPIALASGAHLKQDSVSNREWGFEHVEVDKGRVVEDPGIPGSETEKDEPVGLQGTAPIVCNL